jgi:hypothetical protein
MMHRHDCVHRNGFDKDGNRLFIFTKEYIEEIATLMRALVRRINEYLMRGRTISPRTIIMVHHSNAGSLIVGWGFPHGLGRFENDGR